MGSTAGAVFETKFCMAIHRETPRARASDEIEMGRNGDFGTFRHNIVETINSCFYCRIRMTLSDLE